MMFPLSLLEVSLLLAITAMILLITSELLSSYYGKINILLSKKRLKNSALIFSALFVATVILRIAQITLKISL
jgi:hypothetical protein